MNEKEWRREEGVGKVIKEGELLERGHMADPIWPWLLLVRTR